jgi:hypothetical protein
MKRIFNLPIHPISINNFYYGDKKHGLKPQAKEMQYKIFHALSIPSAKKDLKDLRDYFDNSKHCFRVEIILNVPKSKFFNSESKISSRNLDNSNFEKGIIDCVFLPKHYGLNVPYQAEQMNCDDKYITELYSKKQPINGDYSVDFSIEIIDLPICNF